MKLLLILFCFAFLFFTITGSSSLPDSQLIIAYPTYGQCGDSILNDVRNGVNVIIWFSINLVKDNRTQLPLIQGGPNYTCVATIVGKIKQEGISVTHMISIGGWDSPHPDTSFTAQQWWEAWSEWNQKISRPDLGFFGFDGIDWDLEGNDDLNSQYNHFTVAQLNLVGEFSQLAKKHSLIVSLVPPQSYLDYETPLFDLSLLHTPEWKPSFPYHGRNVYAYIWAKYKITDTQFYKNKVDSGKISIIQVPTFDFVSIQLYEGWSRAGWRIANNIPVTTYLDTLITHMATGWQVDFSSVPEVGIETQIVSIPSTQLVIGLANGWAGPNIGDKCLLVWPSTDIVYSQFKMKPLGFMYWDLADEGKVVNGRQFIMAKELKEMYSH